MDDERCAVVRKPLVAVREARCSKKGVQPNHAKPLSMVPFVLHVCVLNIISILAFSCSNVLHGPSWFHASCPF